MESVSRIHFALSSTFSSWRAHRGEVSAAEVRAWAQTESAQLWLGQEKGEVPTTQLTCLIRVCISFVQSFTNEHVGYLAATFFGGDQERLEALKQLVSLKKAAAQDVDATTSPGMETTGDSTAEDQALVVIEVYHCGKLIFSGGTRQEVRCWLQENLGSELASPHKSSIMIREKLIARQQPGTL